MLTSLGYHTFTIVMRLTYSEAIELYKAFQQYPYVKIRPTGKDKNHPDAFPKGYIAEYIQANKGLKWYVRFDDRLSPFTETSSNSKSPQYQREPTPYSVRATINPKILAGVNDYLAAANEDYLDSVEVQFNIEAAKISHVLNTFDHYSMSRVDFCLNVDVDELKLGCSAKQLMKLIKRGDIPKHFKEWTEYNDTSHRKEANKDALYLQNESITINFYRKHSQLTEEFPECPNLEDSRNLIRFEIQCKYPKVYSMAKENRYDSRLYQSMSGEELWVEQLYGQIITNPIDIMLSNAISEDIICKYIYKVIRRGDYLTLDGAKWIIGQHNFRQDKEDRLIWTLEKINECRSIAKAKYKISRVDINDFKRSLKDLDDIMVNPVTIPREWGIEHIPNPLRTYYGIAFEEQFIFGNEHRFGELLTEYLS